MAAPRAARLVPSRDVYATSHCACRSLHRPLAFQGLRERVRTVGLQRVLVERIIILRPRLDGSLCLLRPFFGSPECRLSNTCLDCGSAHGAAAPSDDQVRRASLHKNMMDQPRRATRCVAVHGWDEVKFISSRKIHGALHIDIARNESNDDRAAYRLRSPRANRRPFFHPCKASPLLSTNASPPFGARISFADEVVIKSPRLRDAFTYFGQGELITLTQDNH